MNKFNELRNKYDTFIFESYSIKKNDDKVLITFDFHVPGLTHYYPTLELDNFEVNEFTEYLIFHIGLVELVSYWKATCSKHVEIKAGFIDKEQIEWFKKLYYYGLGELFYQNGIEISYDDFMQITCTAKEKKIDYPTYIGLGNLIPVGGGKDSNVTLEILKDQLNNSPFIINPKTVHLDCAKAAGYSVDQIITVKRTIDKTLIELNSQGFINGHTPFSALVAFVSYFVAYINNKKYIVLSNEASANESNVIDTKINHQYSKTYEFESDFNNYTKKYFKIDINYFSLLRPLNEYQITLLFSHYEKYHKIFKSCNVGSKQIPWVWCGCCPKCLFVYIMLSPFLYKEKLVNIFNDDLFEKEELLSTFLDLTGYGKNKPFECVGTYKEIRYALTKTISQHKELPFLLEYYKNHYELEDLSSQIEQEYNEENNLVPLFEELLKKELGKYVSEDH